MKNMDLRGFGFGRASGLAVAVVSNVRISSGNIRQILLFGIRTISLQNKVISF